jgi:hypothetical protein
MNLKIFSAVLFFCMASSQSFAQDQKLLLAELNKLNNEIRAESNEKSVLNKLLALQTLQNKYQNNPYANILFPQLIAEELSYLNMHVESIEAMSEAKDDKENIDFNINDYTISSVENSLYRYFRNANIVMVNEAHHIDQHRVFTLNILEYMWEQGFRYLALESLSENFEEGVKDKYVTQEVGSYSKSAFMAMMILHARDLGFKLISYDYKKSDSSDQREENAARTIFDKVFKQDPNAKILIHCGYSHIDEENKLASKLFSITGHDPVTINQTDLRESTKGKESPIYTAISNKLTQSSPIVLLDKSQKPWSFKPNTYDVNVIWPRMKKDNERQSWEKLNRKTKIIKANICVNYPCMIEAFNTEEDAKALPQDRIVIWNKNHNVTLFYNDKLFIKVTESEPLVLDSSFNEKVTY